MEVIVVTGGIGSGKSSVCRIIRNVFGWPVYNADERVKGLYLTSPTLLDSIELSLGRCFRDEQGLFLPSSLASVIFSDPVSLQKVESLVFPELTDDFERWKSVHADSTFVVLESATILEKPQLSEMGDHVVVVDAPVDVRVARAAERDGVSEVGIRGRLSSQRLMNDISDGKVSPAADFYILNDKDEDNLMREVMKMVEILQKQKC